ncbi:MAG: ERF family protein [Limisphaerales bacterium]
MKTITPQPELAVATTQAGAVARPIQAQQFDIEGMFRFALEKSAGPEAMTTLMNIRRELNAEAAKKAFDEALSAFQEECPVITKTKGVPTKSGDIAYRYAPVEQIEAVIRPIERKHGFTHTFDTDVASQPGFVIAKCIVTHSAGHVRESQIKLPLGMKTQIMSDTQVYAGAMTFANRRALANAYGLVIAGEDLDGSDRKQRPAGPATVQQPPAPSAAPAPGQPATDKELRADLWAMLKAHDGTLVASGTWDAAKEFLLNHEVLKPGEKITALPVPRLVEIIAATKKLLGGE